MSVGVVSSKPVIRNFDPRSIPRCSLWFDAADSSTITLSSGSNVGQWASKGNVAVSLSQITASNQPTYVNVGGLSGIQFVGANQCFMRTPTILSGYHVFDVLGDQQVGSNYTCFAVVTLSEPATSCNVLVGARSDNSTFLRLTAVSSNNFTYVAGGTAGGTLLSMTASMNYNSPTVLTLQVSGVGTIRNCLMNGIKQTTSDNATPANLNSSINASNYLLLGDTTLNSNLSGYIHELLLYNTCLPNAARATVDSYLAWKWTSICNVSNPLTLFRSSPRQTILSNYSYVPTTPLWWFDATDSRSLSLNGSTLIQWTSKLSSGVTCTISTGIGTAPVYSNFSNGLPALSFTSTSSQCMFMNNPVTFLNNFQTQIFVMEIPSSVAANTYYLNMEGSNSSQRFFWRSTGGYIQIYNTGTSNQGPRFILTSNQYNVPFIVSYTENNGNTLYAYESFNLYGNGQIQSNLATSYVPSNATISSLVLGGSFKPFVSTGSGTLFSTFRLGEWLAFSPPLTRGQREIVEGYLAAKWGATISGSNCLNSCNIDPSMITACPHPYYRRVGSNIPMLAPTLYSPDGFPNLVLWLDVADFSTISRDSNNLVVQWRDKSICGNHINVTAGTNPTYIGKGPLGNLPLLRGLSGTSISAINNTGNSFFVVNRYSPTAGDASSVFLTNAESLTTSQTALVGRFIASNVDTITFSNTSNVPTLHGFVRPGVGWQYYVNGTLVNSTSNTGSGSNNFRFFNGTSELDYGEVIVYSGTITTWVHRQIEGYLAWKWNTRGYLPSNHPFYLAPP